MEHRLLQSPVMKPFKRWSELRDFIPGIKGSCGILVNLNKKTVYKVLLESSGRSWVICDRVSNKTNTLQFRPATFYGENLKGDDAHDEDRITPRHP
jgi:hypothetical protein